MIVQFLWGLLVGSAVSLVTGRLINRSVEQSSDPVKGLTRGIVYYFIRLGIDALVLFGAYFLGVQIYGLFGIATGLAFGIGFWLLLRQLRLSKELSAGKGGKR